MAKIDDILPDKCRDVRRRLDSVRPHPDNPQRHSESQIKKLMRMIELYGDAKTSISYQNPEFSDLAKKAKAAGKEWIPVICTGHACHEAKRRLGLTSSIMKELDFDDAKAMAWMMDDNHIGQLSEPDMPQLQANMAYLKDMDYEMEDMTWEMGEIEGYDESTGEPQNPWEFWEDMPEFEQEDAIFRTIAVHFQTSNDVDKFAKLIGQNITDKTKYIWFPEIEKRNLKQFEWIDDES